MSFLQNRAAIAERDARAREIIGEANKFAEDVRQRELAMKKHMGRHIILQRGDEYEILKPSKELKVGALYADGWTIVKSVELPEGFVIKREDGR